MRPASLSDGSQSIVVDSALCKVPPSASTFRTEKHKLKYKALGHIGILDFFKTFGLVSKKQECHDIR